MNITIISNDKRYEYLNEQLNELGYNSKLANINDTIDTDILILSVRKEYTDVEYNSIFENSKIKTVLAPKYIDNSIDYTDNEVFLKKNAYLTAEGAITLYYNEVKETLLNKKVLILGYGRIGKYLSKMLKSLNCDVSVYARRKEIQNEIVLDGYKTGAFQNVNYDVVFNTVPTTIINDEFKNCICIELANGFVNKANVINGNGIPGKMFPKTASKIILEAILPYLSI
jgi:dipicolinate synthase subunit A